MRYHYEKPDIYIPIYGERYHCNHPVYDTCTVFRSRNMGLAVIQQRFDERAKSVHWSEIDAWLANDIYLNSGFKAYFDERSGTCKDGLYPTVTVRQIMWSLKMKPIPKEWWETIFDRRDI